MTKAELRKVYLERRAALSKEARATKSRQIAELFFANIDLTKVATLHCFIPIDKFGEVETFIIIDRLRSTHSRIRINVPKVDRETGEITNLAYDSGTELIVGAWGTLEPAIAVRIEPSEIDLVLVPLLCFNESGHRVGYGKGYYDRFLRLCRNDCLKVGLSFFPPVVAIDNIHESDVRLDVCISPDRVYRF